MLLLSHKVEMHCQLRLDEKEVEMLEYLTSIDGALMKPVVGQKYSTEQWRELFVSFRSHLGQLRTRFNETRQVFEGTRKTAQ